MYLKLVGCLSLTILVVDSLSLFTVILSVSDY